MDLGLGAQMSGAVGELLTWLTGGSAPAALVKVLSLVFALVLWHIYRRDLGILGANGRVPAERQVYDRFRDDLAQGNIAARLYAKWLTRFLDWIDRFFGDAGKARQTLFSRVFGLRTPAPLWTASAFHRCLLLAFIYPIATIFIIWDISGHVGPAEAAMGFRPTLGWQRAVAALGVSILVALPLAPTLLPDKLANKSAAAISIIVGLGIGLLFSSQQFLPVSSNLSISQERMVVLAFASTLGGLAILTCTIVGGVNMLNTIAVALSFVAAIAIGVALATVTTIILLLNAFAISTVIFASRGYSPTFITLLVAVLLYGLFISAAAAFGWPVLLLFLLAILVEQVARFRFRSRLRRLREFSGEKAAADYAEVALQGLRNRLRNQVPLAFYPVAIMGCLVLPWVLAPLSIWDVIGPLLLVLGLLTLINAPFDWASIGLTRALLRRGLELGGWWPFALALVDAGLAALVITALALTMVVGVQAFDALAVYRGGASVLALDQLFDGIAKHPSAPEYWWVYALLLSTMIPSLVNLVIAGTSLLRGVPGVASLLLRYIPERGGVLKWDRHWIAAVLTTQAAAGAVLGLAAQVFLVWAIIGHVMPFFGLELLDMARDVADFNLPTRVGQLFGVSL